LFWKQLDLNYPGMPNAMVHHGFYSAYHNTTISQEDILWAGQWIIFVNFDGPCEVKLMTFGQPHIGNSVFASHFSQHVPNTIRVTHVCIYNVCLESLVYVDEKICDASGEDPSCSRSVMGNNITDHLSYYGIQLQAETWGSCTPARFRVTEEH
ncbi:hypothetical protein MKX03_009564, partial [Papaver bracteatum]